MTKMTAFAVILFASLTLSSLGECGHQTKRDSDNLALLRHRRASDKNGDRRLKDLFQKLKKGNGDVLLKTILPDPVPIPDFNFTYNEGFAPTEGSFDHVKLHGLSNLEIQSLSTNFINMEVNIELLFPRLEMKGMYEVQVTPPFFSVQRSNGEFSLQAYLLVAKGNVYLNVTANDTIKVGDVDIDVEVNHTTVNFENVFGNGFGSSFINGILNQTSDVIFSSVKHRIVAEMKKALTKKLNEELGKLPPSHGKSRGNAPIDLMIREASRRMKKDGVDPLTLPLIRKKITKKIAFFKISGEVRIVDGTLRGLSSIHRTGDIELNLSEGNLVFIANMGFDDLYGDFVYGVHFMGMRQYGRAQVTIRHMAISVDLSQEAKNGSHPILNDLQITNVGQIWVSLRGLGPLGIIFQNMINVFTNAFKSKLINVVEKQVKKELQKELEKISIPI